MCVRWARGYNFRINSIVIITCKNNNERKHKLNGPNSGETTDPLVYINVTNFNFFLRSIEFLFRFVFNLFRFDNDIFSAMLFQYSKKKIENIKIDYFEIFWESLFLLQTFFVSSFLFSPWFETQKAILAGTKRGKSCLIKPITKVFWENQVKICNVIDFYKWYKFSYHLVIGNKPHKSSWV